MFTILKLDADSDKESMPVTVGKEATDTHLAVVSGQIVVAQCSLWWNETPELNGKRVGAIGHFEAADEASARFLLNHATDELAAQGCAKAVGPMDGNTWRRYRFITERGDAPPFFLEPDNPDEYPGYFRAAGFYPLAQYGSSLNSDLSVEDSRAAELETKIVNAGIQIRKLNPDRFLEELSKLYAATLKCFDDNFLYTPLDKKDFIQQYALIEPLLKPEIVLIAEHEAEGIVGFIFAVPDLEQFQHPEEIDTMIIKTLGVVPEFRGIGLASHLTNCCQRNAFELLGFRKSIHALMIESNPSQTISQKTAQRIRGYTLFAKDLAP